MPRHSERSEEPLISAFPHQRRVMPEEISSPEMHLPPLVPCAAASEVLRASE